MTHHNTQPYEALIVNRATGHALYRGPDVNYAHRLWKRLNSDKPDTARAGDRTMLSFYEARATGYTPGWIAGRAMA